MIWCYHNCAKTKLPKPGSSLIARPLKSSQRGCQAVIFALSLLLCGTIHGNVMQFHAIWWKSHHEANRLGNSSCVGLMKINYFRALKSRYFHLLWLQHSFPVSFLVLAFYFSLLHITQYKTCILGNTPPPLYFSSFKPAFPQRTSCGFTVSPQPELNLCLQSILLC